MQRSITTCKPADHRINGDDAAAAVPEDLGNAVVWPVGIRRMPNQRNGLGLLKDWFQVSQAFHAESPAGD